MFARLIAFTPRKTNRRLRRYPSCMSIRRDVLTVAHAFRFAPRTRFSRLTTWLPTCSNLSRPTRHSLTSEPPWLTRTLGRTIVAVQVHEHHQGNAKIRSVAGRTRSSRQGRFAVEAPGDGAECVFVLSRDILPLGAGVAGCVP